jgi:shikimate kinase
MMDALRIGVKGVSLSGTGPAYSALVEKEMAEELVKIWEECGTSGKVINTKINNEGLMKL